VALLSLYKRQSCSYLAPATVLIATLSIIAHIDNNATLKPARRSPIEAGDMPLDMARRAAIPLPAPRSAAAGGRRSETRQEFSARSQSGTRRRSPLAERGHAGSRPSWRSGDAGGCTSPQNSGGLGVELAVEPGVESRGAGFRGPAGSRRPEGSRSTPDHAAGKTQARVRAVIPPSGGHMGSRRQPKAVSKALRTVARAWARGRGRATRPSWKTIGAGPASASWGWARAGPDCAQPKAEVLRGALRPHSNSPRPGASATALTCT
jgi:hypothetical protein